MTDQESLRSEFVALVATIDFEFTPPYPRLPFTTEAELGEAVDFAMGLYTDVREAIVRREEVDAP